MQGGAKKSKSKSKKSGGGAVSRVRTGPKGGKYIVVRGVKRYVEPGRKKK